MSLGVDTSTSYAVSGFKLTTKLLHSKVALENFCHGVDPQGRCGKWTVGVGGPVMVDTDHGKPQHSRPLDLTKKNTYTASHHL